MVVMLPSRLAANFTTVVQLTAPYVNSYPFLSMYCLENHENHFELKFLKKTLTKQKIFVITQVR